MALHVQVAEHGLRGGAHLRVTLFLLASLLLHGLAYSGLRWVSTAPQLDFELVLPSHVEFGVTHAAAVEPPAPLPTPEPEAAASAAAPAEGDAVKPKPKPKPKPDAGPPEDAGVAHADAAAPPAPQPAEPVARTDAGAGDAPDPALAAFAPKGAQIALRLHMGALRDSAIADDVRGLLDAIPDWRLIVDGSGIDPLRDLERLFVATPDLKRSSLVVAGQYVGDEALPRKAVASLAAARGIKVRWTKRGGLLTAPWPNADETARTVALIAPQQFVITRPSDLSRVLLVAAALAKRETKPGEQEVDPGAALLALTKGETLALTVEGARAFVRGNVGGVPEQLVVSVHQTEAGAGFASTMRGSYESPEAAEEAMRYWTRVRDRVASHPLVAFAGMRDPLAKLSFEVVESELVARTQVTLAQARVLIGFARSAMPPRAGLPLVVPGRPTPGARSPAAPPVPPPSPPPARPASP